ncbi:MAG: leucine-rich repeat protein [Prevotella sp.]|nr:leucine-rich repeat protein [Candidatus Equicola stercoris]
MKTIKKLSLLCLFGMISIGASAYSFESGGIYYNITSSTDLTCGVTYKEIKDGTYKSDYKGIVNIPASVSYDGEVYSVTSIGEGAFSDCSDLSYVIIPNSVTSIGDDAFYNCSGLASVTIGNSVTSIGDGAFMYCSGLTSIEIPNSVTSIGENAFYKCSGLTSVTIGNSVTSIGYEAFSQCTGLTSIEIPNSVTSIGSGAFYGCSNVKELIYAEGTKTVLRTALTSITSVTIPNSVTSIGDEAFRNCSGLTSATIPNSVTSIGYDAFYHCTSLPVENNLRYADTYLVEAVDRTLSTYNIKEGTKWIGSYAFDICTNLTSINIPNSVTSIGSAAFSDCSDLSYVIIPNSVTSIGYGPFSGCYDLASIVVDKDNKVYDSRDNCNAIIETSSNTLIQGCKNTIIPNSVTSIGNYTFDGCSGLTSIEIPNSVTSLGNSAFDWCSGLTSIIIPNSVTSIGSYAFRCCNSLTSVTIGNSVTSIGSSAFGGCTGLTSIIIPNSVTTIGNKAFRNCSGLTSVTNLATNPQKIGEETFTKYGTLHVIKGCKDAYADAYYWKNFTIVDDVEVTKVTSVTIDESTYYCDVNGVGQATATVKPDDATMKQLTWSSSDPSKLFIDANTGQFVGLAVGEVTITATANDGSGVSGQAIVVVQDPSGIEEVEASPKPSPEGKDLYNLQGMKVSGELYRGIVIKNGKKYLKR